MIRCDVIPACRASVSARAIPPTTVSNRDTASGMGLRVEEDLDVTNALASCTRQVGRGELVEIPFVDEHRACPVVDVQERLQVAEPVGAPDRIRVGIRER